MSSFAAARCQHIKVNGTQCGSPALRRKKFCYYHQENRPVLIGTYYGEFDYTLGEITLPFFEDAHSIQSVIRQTVQMVLQKRLEQKTASFMLYALQIASSNLKRMELEKPQPAEVVVDPETLSQTPMEQEIQGACEVEPSLQTSPDASSGGEDLPPGTIQACYRPGPQTRNRPSQSAQRKKQYVT